ncbi:MAG: hypothetical protein P1V97_21165 [Planctomycetota bacterium]|nr:hypothetical protein [Planctomycetota bacterium]
MRTSWSTMILLGLCLLFTGGCASSENGEESRPFVLTSASRLGDLYWRGELTDSKGRRWNVWIIPGIATSVEVGAEAFEDAYDFAKGPAEQEFWRQRGEEFQDGIKFAFEDCIGEFLLEGIAEDYVSTGENISANVNETPFGWIPRIMGNVLWGYVLCPVGRIALAPVGMVGGLGYSTVWPTTQVVARPAGGVAWMGLAGIATPVLRIGVHQPIYFFSVFNREPSADQNGQFGLEVIHWGKNGPPNLPAAVIEPEPKPAPMPPRVKPKPQRSREWTEADHLKAYRDRPSYRKAYDYGFRKGLKEGRREAYRNAQSQKKSKGKDKNSDKAD